MKINFFLTYRELSQYLKRGRRSQEFSQNFGATLGEVLNKGNQIKTVNRGEDGKRVRASIKRERLEEFFKKKVKEGVINRGEKRVEKDDLTLPNVSSRIFQESAPTVVSPPKVIKAYRVGSQEQTVDRKRISSLITKESRVQKVDPLLALAVADVESSLDPTAVSQDKHKSKGIFQLLDSTGQELLKKSGSNEPYDPFNPEQNIRLGVRYLRELLELFSKRNEALGNYPAVDSEELEKLAAAAFNAGQKRVADAQKAAKEAGLNPGQFDSVENFLPETTRQYVQRVSEKLKELLGSSEG
ncbi:MAG: hypothetical protein D6780_06425 [Candidatus Dadabacteria bacterium]|nr:MAG: hypothetical protein D6780_06425 [Candidatus Dadabacteria bacterium]